MVHSPPDAPMTATATLDCREVEKVLWQEMKGLDTRDNIMEQLELDLNLK